MTDREAINLVFKAVCALAEKLTGERLQMRVYIEGQGSRWITSENTDIIFDWVPLEKDPTREKAEKESHNSAAFRITTGGSVGWGGPATGRLEDL